MAIRTYKVTLDTKNTIAPEPVYLRQGDKTGAVVIDATLMDNGSPVSLDSLTPMFKANTADGQAVIADITGFNVLDSANGEFTYQVPNALSSVPGKITTAYFSFSDSSGSESTFDVAFIIKKAVDITQEQADDYITIIDGTLQSLQQKIDAMSTDIQTIINNYDIGNFYNKSETDAKNAEITAQLDEATSVDIADEVMGGIRDIFEIPLYNMKNQLESKKNNVNIGHITDVHYVVRSNYWGDYPAASYGLTHLLNIGAVSSSLGLIVSGGDNADENNKSKANILKHQLDFATTLDTVSDCPIIIGIGNHDDNSVRAAEANQTGTDFLVKDDEFSEIYFQKNSRFGEVRDGKSNYCYYDIPDSNIRTIWLDLYQNPITLGADNVMKYPRSNTSIIQENQLEWLATKALKTGKDILIFSHCPINGTFSGQPTKYWHNHDMILQLLNGFVGKTSGVLTGSSIDFPVNVSFDFSGQRGDIVSVVSGHRHVDDYILLNGINYVLTAQSVGKDFNGNEYWYTSEEDSWAVFSIDETAKLVEILKFGRGTGRSFSYGGTNL